MTNFLRIKRKLEKKSPPSNRFEDDLEGNEKEGASCAAQPLSFTQVNSLEEEESVSTSVGTSIAPHLQFNATTAKSKILLQNVQKGDHEN
jgi:hypothetical protein